MYSFERELAFYKINKLKLLSLFHGKFLVIKDNYLIGVSGNMYGAYGMIHTLQEFYDGPPIMMKQCLYNEPVAGIPGGLTWQDDKGNPVEADPRDLIAYEEGSRIKFAPDASFISATGSYISTRPPEPPSDIQPLKKSV